ncbi:MAG: hypothetical protein ACXAEI_01910 [Candidatus Hodarchaeales archaeon]
MIESPKKPISRGLLVAFVLVYLAILFFLLLMGHYHGFYLIGWVILASIFLLFFIPLYNNQERDYPWLMERSDKMLRIMIFLMAFSLRAIFLFDIPSREDGILSEDVLKYSNKARRVKHGKLPYRDFDTAYGPLHNYLIAIASFIATDGPDSKPFVWDYDLAVVLMFKLLACLCDSISSVLVMEIGRLWNLSRDRAALCAFGYSMNPLSIVEFGWAGHNDAIVVMFMLLSLYAYLRGEERSSAILLAAATTMKYWPGFYMLIFICSLLPKENGRYRAANYFATYVITGIIISLPFLILAPVEFLLGIVSLAEGGGNIYDRLSYIAVSTDIVVKGLLQSENEALRDLVKTLFSMVAYLGVLAFIAAFALTQVYPQRFSFERLLAFIHVVILVLLGVWGIGITIYALVAKSPLFILGIAMFFVSFWLLKSNWEVYVNDHSLSGSGQSAVTDQVVDPNDAVLEGIMWTGFLLLLVNATYHAWYYAWFLPVFFIVIGKKTSYINLLYLIFLHQPLSYITTELYFRGFWP